MTIHATGCPDQAVISEYKNGKLEQSRIDELTPHLVGCDTCMLMLELLPVDELPRLVNRGLRRELDLTPFERFISDGRIFETGQVWSTKTTGIVFPTAEAIERYSAVELGGDPIYVVISSQKVEARFYMGERFQVIRVVPVTDNVEFAIEDDDIIPEDESMIGYAIMLQNWNEQEMLAENLESLVEGWTYWTNPAGNPSEYSFFHLISDGKYGDAKMRFRSREFNSTAFLRDPVDSLRSIFALQIVGGEREKVQSLIRDNYNSGDQLRLAADATSSGVVAVEWQDRTFELHFWKKPYGIEVYCADGNLIGKTLGIRWRDRDLTFNAVFKDLPADGMKVRAFLECPVDISVGVPSRFILEITE